MEGGQSPGAAMNGGGKGTGVPPWAIVLLGAAALVAVLATELLLALSALDCETRPPEERQHSVRCAAEDSFWTDVLAAIFVAAPLAILIGGIAAAASRRLRLLVVAGITAVALLLTVPPILSIRLPADDGRVSAARFDSSACQRPPLCADGIPVTFTASDSARLRFSIGWNGPDRAPPPLDPESGEARLQVIGPDGELEPVEESENESAPAGDPPEATYKFESGAHTVRLVPHAGTAPGLPAGPYRLTIEPQIFESIDTKGQGEEQEAATWKLEFEAGPR
jgi:hypothetical protein